MGTWDIEKQVKKTAPCKRQRDPMKAINRSFLEWMHHMTGIRKNSEKYQLRYIDLTLRCHGCYIDKTVVDKLVTNTHLAFSHISKPLAKHIIQAHNYHEMKSRVIV